MIFRVKFHHENSGNCTTTFKDVDGNRYFNRIHSNHVDAGKWCTVHPSGGYWESDTPCREDVEFVVVDGDGNTLFTESNANLGVFQSVCDKAREFTKEWAEKHNLRPYEKWKKWLAADMEKHGYGGYIDNWLHAETGILGSDKVGCYKHLGMDFTVYSERMDHIICGKKWRYVSIINMTNNNTEALCGFIFEEADHE